VSVCLYFGYESFDFGAKTNEPIEMFVLWTCVGPENHAVDGGPEPPVEGPIFDGGMTAFATIFYSSPPNFQGSSNFHLAISTVAT